MSNSAITHVNLGKRSYDIHIGAGNLIEFGGILKEELVSERAAVITNDKVWSLHGSALAESFEKAGVAFEKFIVPDGESAKSLPVAERIYGELIEAGFERDEPIVGFGGGVVGDFAGFIAATYQRGVPLVHVPTTLLSQIDSSIGGKVAVNHPHGKNMIGTFYQPVFVYSDVTVLKTLEIAQLRNGLAEAIKYGFIWADGPLAYIEDNLKGILAADPSVMAPLVDACSKIKAKVVEIDETDRGLRAILNYGHTFGHAIETSSHYAYGHGEAVAIGMNFAARLSSRLGLINHDLVERQERLLKKAGLPIRAEHVDIASVIKAMSVDKKRQRGENLFVLLEGVGVPLVRPVPEDVIMKLAVELV